jgi:hypothetical protein
MNSYQMVFHRPVETAPRVLFGESIDLLATVEKRGPLVRDADYTSMWKVTHWKSVNTTVFLGTDL